MYNARNAYICFIPEDSPLAPPTPGVAIVDSPYGGAYLLGVCKSDSGVTIVPDKTAKTVEGCDRVVRWRLEVNIDIVSRVNGGIYAFVDGKRGWLMFLPSSYSGQAVRLDEGFGWVVMLMSPTSFHQVLIAGPIVLNLPESYKYGGENNVTQIRTSALAGSKHELYFNAIYQQ